MTAWPSKNANFSSSTYALPPYARILWVFAALVFGLIPTVLFFVWVERNTALPLIPLEMGWPWISLHEATLTLSIIWNSALVAVFGFLHTTFAQTRVTRAMEAVFPPQTIRIFYVCLTGTTLFLMMALWQHTGIVVWNMQAPARFVSEIIAAAIYWSLLGVAAIQVSHLQPLHFSGLRQLYSYAKDVGVPEGTQRLSAKGLYGHVRHPVYTFTLAAFLVTPFMSLDRMIVSGVTLLYLAVAIPIEERKLIAGFGEDYVAYRKKVPALFPRSWT